MAELWVIESKPKEGAAEWFVCNWFKTETEARTRMANMNKDWPDHHRRIVRYDRSPEELRA